MAEVLTLYGLSDIKNIWVPCSECEKESAFPLDSGFDTPLKQHVVTKCTHCGCHGFGGTFKAIRRIQRLSEEDTLEGEKNLLSQIKIEVDNHAD